jgi:hypothetical protein
MKRLLFGVLLLTLMWMPFAAQAQANTTFSVMVVQLWPEYDRAAMLVLLDFKLAGSGETGQSVTLQLPADAEIYAVAREMDGSLVVEPYESGAANGAATLTLNAVPGVSYRVEYYAPLARDGNTRRYHWGWAGSYAIESLQVSLLLPPNALNLQSQPALQSVMQPDGSTLYALTLGPLAAGEAVQLEIAYDKPDESLTVNQTPTQPTTVGGEVPSSASSRLRDALPLVLVSIGVLLLVVGGYFYLRPERVESEPSVESSGKNKARKRGKRRQNGGEVRYCPNCGHRAEPGDKFCRACGSRLR